MSSVLQLIQEQRQDLYISASALRTLETCARQYWYRYVEGAPREDVPSRMILGGAVHRAVAHFYRCLRDGDEVPSIDALMSIAGAAISKAAASDPPILYDSGQDAADVVEEASRLLLEFLRSAYRPAKVLGVEVPFSLPLVHPESGEVLPFEEHLVGAIDLVAKDPDGAVEVIDHKISARLDAQKTKRPDLQMSLYSWVASDLFQTRDVRLRYQDLVRTKVAKVAVQDIRRAPHDEAEAFEAVAAGLELVHVAVTHQNGKRLMGRRRSWRCKDCSFRQRCGEDRP